ncbi:hypothetical protein U9M48_011792, partial [Paspalum notatum var. saurae]
MLFILVMDVLNSLVSKASLEGLLLPLAGQHSTHRISLYADDVALSIRPIEGDLRLIQDLLDCFGQVTGLKTNLLKSSATSIQCSDEDIARTSRLLSCSIKSFPCTYLGLPLTVLKPTKLADFMKVIDKVADKLPGWKAPLLNKAGRLVVVKSVLTAVTIHLLIAWDLPKWVIKVIDKLRRGFLWSGHKQANGGNCLVSWGRVQQPLCYGGLGWSLCLRWLWMLKADANQPWAGLPIQVLAKARALFDMAVVTSVGNGADTKFWTDRWLQRPICSGWFPKEQLRGVLVEYLAIWDLVDGLELRADVPDQQHWKLSSFSCYSSKSAYDALFVGTIKFSPWKRIWKSWAPPNCKFFIWLAILNRCWTSNRLAKCGLPHQPSCPLCDQADESIQHLLMQCVVAREFLRDNYSVGLGLLGSRSSPYPP